MQQIDRIESAWLQIHTEIMVLGKFAQYIFILGGWRIEDAKDQGNGIIRNGDLDLG